MNRLYKFDTFKGGLNFSSDEEQIPRNATQRAQNVSISDGSLRTAAGYTKYVSTGIEGGIGSLLAFHKKGADSSLVAAAGDKVYYWSGSAWTEIGNGFTSDFFSGIMWQKELTEMLIMVNGNETPRKWTGPGNNLEELAGSPPKFKFITLHQERMWGIGDPDNLSSVWYSNEVNPEDWTIAEDDAGKIDILTWDGGICTMVVNIFDDPVVYKTYNIWRFAGSYPNEYVKNQVFSSDGTIAPRSVVAKGTTAYHLCHDGIYVYDGNQASLLGKEIIRPWILDNANRYYIQNACAAIFDGTLYIALATGSSTVNDTVLEFDTLNGNFMIRKGIEVSQFLEFDRELLFVNSDGYVYRYGTGTDYDGKDMKAFYETPWEDGGDRSSVWQTGGNRFSQKRITRLKMRLKGKVKVTFVTDDRERPYIYEAQKEQIIDSPVYAQGARFKVRFENVNGSSFHVNKVQLAIDEWVI